METIKIRTINLIISAVFCVFLYAYLDYFVVGLVEYIFEHYLLYFVPRIGLLQILIIGFIPYWAYLCYRPKASWAKILSTNLIFLLSLVLFIYLGGLFAMQFDNRASPLLPKYIVMEVFPYYWIAIVIVGVMFPMLYYRPWLRRTNTNKESIKNELLDSN
jgi:hypothetical protein